MYRQIELRFCWFFLLFFFFFFTWAIWPFSYFSELFPSPLQSYLFSIVQSEIVTKHKLVRKVFCNWDMSKSKKDFQIILCRKEIALLTCYCKIILENYTVKEANWQDPTQQWAHAIKLNSWILYLYYKLQDILIFRNITQIYRNKRKAWRCKGRERGETACFLSHIRILISSLSFPRCAWPR